MANTERFAVLKLIREAKTAVRNARFDTTLEPDQKPVIEKLYIDLEKLEDDLILGVIDERIESLKNSSESLEKVAEKIKQDIKKLEARADMVDKVAKALKILVDISVKASSLGIL